MRIAGIHIDGFGKLKDLGLSFEDGLNIISGANEAGKSTIHIFIRAMLYGADDSRKGGKRSVYERMRPWNTPSVYGGSMDVYKDGRHYRITRDFARAADDLAVSCMDDGGGPVQDSTAFMSGLVNSLTESAYACTVSSGQLGIQTDRGLASEIVKYASNMASAVNPELSAEKALRFLDNKKQSLNDRLQPDAPREYNRLLSRAAALEKAIMDPGRSNLINDYKAADVEAERLVGETAMDLAQNELIISDREERLRSHGLYGANDVEALRDSVMSQLALYSRKKKAVPVYTVLAAAGIIAGIAGLFLGTQNISGLAGAVAPYRLYILIAAAVFLIFGVLMLILSIVTLRGRNSAYDSLYGLLEEHIEVVTGDQDKDMEQFYEQVELYLRDAGTVGAARDERMRLRDRLKGLNSDRSSYVTELKRQQDIKAGVERDLEELGRIRKRLTELERIIETNKELRDSIDAVELASETITRLASGIRGSAGTYINAEAGRMLEGVTGGAYNSLDMGMGQNIRVNSRRGLIPIEDMSRGTADQIYLAVRIASARFLAGEGDELPLIMDESFVLYDEDRLLSSLRFLTDNYRGQILVFTCRPGEESALAGAGIRYNLVRL